MKFELQGKIILNRRVEGAEVEQDIAHFFESAKDTFLSKGAPPGKGAIVDSWSIENDTILITLTSGQHVRAHDALLRLKKNLGLSMGKKHKLGARMAIADLLKIEFQLTRAPLEDIKVPFINEIQIDSGNLVCIVKLENLTEEFMSENYIDRILRLVNTKIERQYYEGKSEHWVLMWSSGPRDVHWSKDPTEEMQKLGWLKQGPTKGKWFFQPQLTAVMRAMESIALNDVLQPLGFQEVIQSHLVPFDIWLRTGHIEGTPNEFYYVSEPKTRDISAWDEFRDLVYITRQVPQDKLSELLRAPNAGICYAQCPGMYWSLQGKVLAEESLPILIFDRAANSNRYESGGRHGIERVDEFHRLEPIYIGHPEQLVELREKFIERYKLVFNDILELDWRMAWVTPWYLEQSGQISEDDSDDNSKIKGTIDFEGYLPYRGSREDSEWLEYQNLSIIGDKFIQAFNIKSQRGELWSGCSGIGLERWTAVFLAQKGLNPSAWPEKFKRRLGELPSGYKTL